MRTAMASTAIIAMIASAGLIVPATAVLASATSCQVVGATQQTQQALRESGSTFTDGIQAHEQWLADAQTQQVNQELHRQTEALLGPEPRSKERIADQLRRGLIGYVADSTTQTLAVVLTPESSAERQLRTGIASALDAMGFAAPGPKIDIVLGCHSAASLIAADELLMARTWHPDASKANFTYRLDPADSTFYVSFDERYPAAARALRSALGTRVVVELGSEQMLTGRYDDGEPHYGGAGIRVGAGTTSSNTCTSGFMVRRNSDGRKGMAAAAHCFNNGQSIYSGPQYYGTTADEASASYDAIGIYSTTETYAPIIHVEPCSPCVRTVLGSSVPAVNSYVCVSGMSTTALCSIKIISNDSVYCWSFGCVYGLIAGERWDKIIVRPGDSGGPMYTRMYTDSASINGMIVGQDPAYGGYRVLAERLGSVEDGLNATLVTG